MFLLMNVIVVGATGLVGKNIVSELTHDIRVSKVLVFVRRPLDFIHPKIDVRIVDFDKIEEWKNQINGDVLFSALGTTLHDAGSKAGQYRVDHDYQLAIARYAAYNEVKAYVLISSVNADPHSIFFYLRMKGELEEKVGNLSFPSLFILRPGPLVGKREKPRWQEKVSTVLLNQLPKALVTPGMRPVSADKVAKIAVRLGLSLAPGIHISGPKSILFD